MRKELSNYETNAVNFLRSHNAKMKIYHIMDNYGCWETSGMTGGYLYRVRIDREGKTWSFNFSDSLHNRHNNLRPGKYDVLACIEKYEPYGDVWDFASEFGYEINSRNSYKETEKIFKAVRREYRNVIRMFGDCIDELREIQ